MDNQETGIKQLKENLYSCDDQSLIEEINKLREAEAIPGALLLLMELYEASNNNDVHLVIEKFFNDLNDQSSTEEVITAIDSSNHDLTKQKIISSCWQSGLDYSSHIQKFVEYSIELSYLAALECYSVMEEWVDPCSADDRKRWRKMIKESLKEQSDEKQALLSAIISLL